MMVVNGDKGFHSRKARPMVLAVAVGLSALGAALVAIAAWIWRRRSRARRALAAVLAGEITATLETIEAQDVMAALDRACAHPHEKAVFPKIVLPRFVIYESSAGTLDRLDIPLQRKVVHLFERLAMLSYELGELPDMLDRAEDGQGASIRHMRENLDQTLTLADEVLLSLRPIMSPRNQAKHLTPSPQITA
jgi:hypothetical protein